MGPGRGTLAGSPRPLRPASDSRVGYIDGATPGDQLRFRFDAAHGNRRPTRAEFFYPQPSPRGPGLPFPERSVDSQDLSAYAETALDTRLSFFLQIPVRLLNPEVNANAGLADLDAGFKYALLHSPDGVLSFQLRTYAPTGDADRGLGTNHASLGPALLLYRPLAGRLALESEVRYWVPLGGTEFAGDVIRYGAGLRYDVGCGGSSFSPVAEVVGWTVLGGRESVTHSSGQTTVEGAAGDTIVNAKLGVRLDIGPWGDVYAGYGRPLTGEGWYDHTYRVELHLLY